MRRGHKMFDSATPSTARPVLTFSMDRKITVGVRNTFHFQRAFVVRLPDLTTLDVVERRGARLITRHVRSLSWLQAYDHYATRAPMSLVPYIVTISDHSRLHRIYWPSCSFLVRLDWSIPRADCRCGA
jgi:hypothetical protein